MGRGEGEGRFPTCPAWSYAGGLYLGFFFAFFEEVTGSRKSARHVVRMQMFCGVCRRRTEARISIAAFSFVWFVACGQFCGEELGR